jgi:hypothetical protein
MCAMRECEIFLLSLPPGVVRRPAFIGRIEQAHSARKGTRLGASGVGWVK